MSKPLALIVSCIIAALGHILLKKGLNKIGQFEFTEILARFGTLLSNSYIVGAIFLYSIAVLIYLSLLSRNQLSTLYPVAVGIDFALVALASYLFFGESFSWMKISGLILILGGISCFFRA